VATHVDACCEVVEPVAEYKAQEGSDDGGEVEEAFMDSRLAKGTRKRYWGKGLTNLLQSEIIKWS